jgi:hypothetical protein
MQKKKLPRDSNSLAARIVAMSTGQDEPDLGTKPKEDTTPKTGKEKNPAAVALGRLGGLKGGKARAEKLSAKKRKEIGRKAANARWDNAKDAKIKK